MPSSPVAIAVPVPLQDSPYEILIGEGLLGRVGELTAKVVTPCLSVVITDDRVAPLHGSLLMDSLKAAGQWLPPYTYLFTDFVPLLRERGLNEQEIFSILDENPRRFFAGEALPSAMAT